MKHRKISIHQATPGMVAAEDVYTFSNQKIITMNTALTDRIITRLKFYGINQFLIYVPESTSSNEADNISNEKTNIPYSQKIKESLNFKRFKQNFVLSVTDLRDALNEVVATGKTVDTQTLLSSTKQILAHCNSGGEVFDMIHCMREYDDLTYVHSINVSLICNVFGRWLKMSDDDIEKLTLCGLLHDIGKLTIPQHIISKPTKLTDEEYKLIKLHTVRGYQILKDQNIDVRIKYAALMHHERCDGTGYPNGFTSANISDFAKIVAIADVYDAMTSARIYRGPLCPFEAIELYQSEGLQKYDPHYILTFLEGIVQTYIHNNVRLSDGRVGEVIMMNKHALSKPIVRIDNIFVDLSKEPNLTIEAIE